MYDAPRSASIKSSGVGRLFTLDRNSFKTIMRESIEGKNTEVFAALKKVKALAPLSDDELHRVADTVMASHYAPGDNFTLNLNLALLASCCVVWLRPLLLFIQNISRTRSLFAQSKLIDLIGILWCYSRRKYHHAGRPRQYVFHYQNGQMCGYGQRNQGTAFEGWRGVCRIATFFRKVAFLQPPPWK